MIKLLFLVALSGFIAPAAYAKQCQTDFCKISRVAQELSKYPYSEAGSVESARGNFDGGNCIDFTMEAWERFEALGFTDLKMVTLVKGNLSHMVLEINGIALSAGPNGVAIKQPKVYYTNWDEVY